MLYALRATSARKDMSDGSTVIAGIEVPSTDPVFLAIVGIHIPLGLLCVVTGAIAMLSNKGRGRHTTFGTVYFWCLFAVAVSATLLSIMRWPEDYHLFALGASAFGCAWLGRLAIRRHRVRLHLSGMGSSYTLMLVAFYVDNGPQLPLWRSLPHVTYWLLPLAVAIPIMTWAMLRHPLVRSSRAPR
jgi:uncharacterized membrane protein